MTTQPFRFTLFLLICLSIPVTATAQIVNIPDANLRAAIEQALGKASGAAITTADMATLTRLDAPNANISDLTGLEQATNLTRLALSRNTVSDISAVSGLTNLIFLYLDSNTVSDISAVSGLTNLRVLNLDSNTVSDISAVSGLTNLIFLYLQSNRVSDLSPLVSNTGLGRGNSVRVRENPLSAVSINTHIPTLQGRGVNVQFDAPAPVNIPDPNLRAKIEDALGKASGATITTADMANLTELTAPNANISDLTGLEHATNLRVLDLGDRGDLVNSNSVSDLSPLTGLTKLNWLFLGVNRISDISALVGLTNLTRLNLRSNNISDLSPLTGLTNLTYLSLGGTGRSISDISAVAGLTKLTYLNLNVSSISDISPVAGLTNLTSLSLTSSRISDISAVTGLTNLTYLDLGGNRISDISAVAGLTKLAYLYLGNNISDISPVAGLTNLVGLDLRYNNISDISAVAGLTRLWWLVLNNNRISDISPLVDNTGLGTGDTVRVGHNPLSYASINTHIPALQSRGVDVKFDAVVAETVTIPDPNLRAKIEEALGKASGAAITTADMARLTRLVAPSANISDLTGLEQATNLTSLSLRNNTVSDISAVSGLTNLTSLSLYRNTVSDISAVSGLTNLTSLYLYNNTVSDISAVAGLTNLTSLYLYNNTVSDISAVSGLTNLTSLYLHNNTVSDISAVSGLTNLTSLSLYNNTVSDISAVSGLTNLTSLYLYNNTVSDISAVAGLTNLTSLYLHNNTVSDILAVSGLTNLTSLYLFSNTISDISAVSGLTNLRILYLSSNTISDISAVAGLTNLTSLYLSSNTISDISPLVSNTGLGTGDEVDVRRNALNTVSINAHIPTLQRRGVTVRFDAVVVPTVNKPDLVVQSPRVSKGTVSPGESFTLSATVRNSGSGGAAGTTLRYYRSTNRTISGSDTPVGTDAVGSLNANSNSPESITLNALTTPGTYYYGACVGTVSNETDTTNNCSTAVTVTVRNPADVNRDGVVDLQDIAGIVTNWEQRGQNNADVDGNGIVDVEDIVLVLAAIEATAAAPAFHAQGLNLFTVEQVQQWLIEAKALADKSPAHQRGILRLEQLLAILTPQETALLANYPNPFNPETWIPYRLAAPAEVTLRIYAANGQVVRTLAFGHQAAGFYEGRHRAAYWDGRNAQGEPVASGVYFYHLSAGDYSATRRMLILK